MATLNPAVRYVPDSRSPSANAGQARAVGAATYSARRHSFGGYYDFILNNLPREVQTWPVERQADFICIFAGMVQQESGWQPDAVSVPPPPNPPAYGLCQMQTATENGTAREFGLIRPSGMYKDEWQLCVGMHHLLKLFNGAGDASVPLEEKLAVALSHYTMGSNGAKKFISGFIASGGQYGDVNGGYWAYLKEERPGVYGHYQKVKEYADGYRAQNKEGLITDLSCESNVDESTELGALQGLY